MTDAQRCAPRPDGRSALGSAGTEFYGDLRLSPLLRGVIAHSGELLGAAAGSVSLLDPGRGRYTKVAERGAACRLGQTFPLDEGVTGRVVSRRGPVVLRSYRDLATGHLPAGDVGDGAVAAVPIWWRGDVMGVNVVFAGRRRRFSRAEVDELDTITQSAAAAIVTAAADDVALGHLRPGPPAPRRSDGADASPLTPRESEVLGLVSEGLGDQQVARALGISVGTVEKHVGAVLRKTGTGNRTAAAVHALRLGWAVGGPGT